MKNILLFGSYHSNNKGDELIFYSIKSLLNEYFNNKVNLTLVTTNPEYFNSNYNINVIRPGDLIKIIKAIKSSDIIMIGGGGLFFDYSLLDTLKIRGESQIIYWFIITVLAGFFRKRVMWYRVGFGPIKTNFSKNLIKYSSKYVEKIIVRDNYSYKFLVSLNISKEKIIRSHDVVFRLKLKRHSNGKYILIIPRYWNDSEDRIFTFFSNVISSLLDEGNNVVISETNHKKDGILSKMLYYKFRSNKNLSYSPINSQDKVHKLINIIRRSKLLISMRMHPIIIASKLGIPVIGIEYNTPKIIECMKQIGMSKYLSNFKEDESKILKMILSSLNKREEIRKIMKNRLEKIENENTEFIEKI